MPLEQSSTYVNSRFDELYSSLYLGTMAKKLGFITPANPNKEEIEDHEYECIKSLFEVMEKTSTDFTNGFRTLALISRSHQFTETDDLVLDRLVTKYSAPVEHRAI